MTIICITGMHRSGTSMITRLLNLCDVYLGEERDIMLESMENPEGYWENYKFVDINEKILSNLKGGWDLPPIIYPGWESLAEIKPFYSTAQTLIESMGTHDHWGWKDPRNSLTIAFWKLLIPNLRVVICVRNPYEVAQSLARRGSSSIEFSANLWNTYYERLLESTTSEEYIITHYESFFYDSHAELHRLLSFLKIPEDKLDIETACNSINTARRHNRLASTELKKLVPSETIKLYDSLCSQAGPVFQNLSTKRFGNNEIHKILEPEKKGATAEQLVNNLRERLMQKTSFIENLENQLNGQKKIIQTLELSLQNKEQALQYVNATLDDIHNSKGWQLILVIRKIRLFIFPYNSTRERIIKKVLAGLRKIKLLIGHTNLKPLRENKITQFLIARRQQFEITRLARKVRLKYQNLVPISPTITVIIPVFNQIEYTLNCLLSLSLTEDKTDYEIIIADDASTDKTQQLLMNIKGIRYRRNPSNKGFIANCNEAAKGANGRYIVFLNNDTVPHKYWLDNLLATFLDHPGTGLAGSKLILPNGKLQEAGSVIWADGSAMNYGRDRDPQEGRVNYVCEVDYVSGASIMLPKDLWDVVGGFDTKYQPAYYEDVDLAFKVRKAGYKVVYQPFSQITHLEGGSNGTDLQKGIKRFQVLNQEKFYDTWKDIIISHGTKEETPDYLQRDRHSKGHILFIDDGTPKPDHYAGDVLSEFYMATLRRDGYSVTFLPHIDLRYADGYTQALQKKGVECIYQPFTSSEQYIRKFGMQFDFVVVSRANVATEIIDTVKTYCPHAKIIFNTIDLHFLRIKRASQIAETNHDLARNAMETELSVIQEVDCTLVVSNAEKNILTGLAPHAQVQVVPFPADVHEIKNGFDKRRDVVFLGGFMHEPNVDAVSFFAREVWPVVKKSLPEARFVIAGADVTKEIKQLESESIRVIGFVKDLANLFETAKLSVAPIRYGAGIKGKVLTSLGYGVPCVATNIASEGIGAINEISVLIANTPQEHVAAVKRLYSDSVLWNTLSKNGQDLIQDKYSRATVASSLLNVLKTL